MINVQIKIDIYVFFRASDWEATYLKQKIDKFLENL